MVPVSATVAATAVAPSVAPAAETSNKVLCPSPMQIEKEVRDAGMAEGLADLVPKKTFDMSTQDKDRVAVRTGMVLAYATLAGRTTPKPEFLAQLRSVRDGLATLGTGKGLLANIDAFVQNVENDSASRDDFLQELDAVAANMVPEDGWGPGDRTGPLLQAGGWLAGINLVAQAVIRADNGAAADTLLRKPYVTEYFLRYVKDQGGAEKAGPLAQELTNTLSTLHALSAMPKLGLEEARSIVATTDKLFSYL